MSELTQIIVAIITAVGVLGAGGCTGYFISKRKGNAEIKSIELANLSKEIELYRGMIDDLLKRLKEAIEELTEARKSIEDLELKILDLTNEIKKYKQLNGKTE